MNIFGSTQASKSQKSDFYQLRQIAYRAAIDNVGASVSETVRRERSRLIADYALRRADGICEGCEEAAPFLRRNGQPYLEVHHIVSIAAAAQIAPLTLPRFAQIAMHVYRTGRMVTSIIEKLEIEFCLWRRISMGLRAIGWIRHQFHFRQLVGSARSAFWPTLRLLVIQISGDWMSPSLRFSKKIRHAGRQPALLSGPLPTGSLNLLPSDMTTVRRLR